MAVTNVPEQTFNSVTPPTVPAVDVETVKDYLRLDTNDDDKLILALIYEATEFIENNAGIQLIQATWQQFFDRFPPKGHIEIRKLPVSSITHVKYIDTDGTQQTWTAADYQVDLNSKPVRIMPAYNETWPIIRRQFSSIEIQFVAGYGTASTDVSDKAKRAVAVLASHWYENREPVSMKNKSLPYHFQAILDSLKWEIR